MDRFLLTELLGMYHPLGLAQGQRCFGLFPARLGRARASNLGLLVGMPMDPEASKGGSVLVRECRHYHQSEAP